jgi:hypothetical protein
LGLGESRDTNSIGMAAQFASVFALPACRCAAPAYLGEPYYAGQEPISGFLHLVLGAYRSG